MERTPVAVTVHALHGQCHLPLSLIFDVRQSEPEPSEGASAPICFSLVELLLYIKIKMKNPILYSSVKFIDAPNSEFEINSKLGNGWVLIGIEQKREWDGEENFEDKTRYILGKQIEEN
jgi:hypothetical protein